MKRVSGSVTGARIEGRSVSVCVRVWELTVSVSVSLFYLSIYPSIHLSIYPSIHPSIHLSIYVHSHSQQRDSATEAKRCSDAETKDTETVTAT
jgi:hypothetical protein